MKRENDMIKKKSKVLCAVLIAFMLASGITCAAKKYDASTTVNFSYQSNIIAIRVRINGITKDFLLDTGASRTTFSDALLKELGIREIEKVRGRGLGGEHDVSIVHIDSIGVGDITLYDFSCTATDFSNLAGLVNDSVYGLLGYDFLSHFRITIDYQARTIRFDKYKDESSSRFIITGDTFFSPKLKIRLVRPNQSWQFDTNTPLSITTVMLKKENSSAVIQVKANEMQGTKLDKLMPLVKSSTKAGTENYQNISSSKKTGVFGDYYETDYTGEKDGVPMQFKQVVFKNHEYLYNITYSAKISEFQQSVIDFDRIIQSVSFM
jgi:hypothetical protein